MAQKTQAGLRCRSVALRRQEIYINCFNCVEESLRVKLRCGSQAAGSAVSSFLWAGGRPTTKLHRHGAITQQRGPSGKNDCPGDQNSTCAAPAITRAVTEATRVTVASAHQALAFNYGRHESPNPRHKLYIKKRGEHGKQTEVKERRAREGSSRVKLLSKEYVRRRQHAVRGDGGKVEPTGRAPAQ